MFTCDVGAFLQQAAQTALSDLEQTETHAGNHPYVPLG